MIDAGLIAAVHTQTLHFIGECPDVAHCSFRKKYFGLMSDGPHACFELTMEIITGLPLYFMGRHRARSVIQREHLVLDVEHGVRHHPITRRKK